MKLKIAQEAFNKPGFSFEESIELLLRFIPIEHLQGLDRIVLVNAPAESREKVFGRYYLTAPRNEAALELYADRLFAGTSDWLFFIPLAATRVMAYTFYYLLGKHYYAQDPRSYINVENNAQTYAARFFSRFQQYHLRYHRRILPQPVGAFCSWLLTKQEPYRTRYQNCLARANAKEKDVPALLELADMHWAYFADLRQAKRLYRQVLKINPQNGDAYYGLATEAWHRGQWSKAAEFFVQSARLGTSREQPLQWWKKARRMTRKHVPAR